MAVLAAAAAVCLTAGCRPWAIRAGRHGHLNLVNAARPVAEWLADPATPPALKQRLELSQRIREFAVSDLGEPDNASYRRYADLGRTAAVWNVVAAPELSLTLKTWCFVVVGWSAPAATTRGPRRCRSAGVRSAGYEALVYPVPGTRRSADCRRCRTPAHTFLPTQRRPRRLIFHELASGVYVPATPGSTSPSRQSNESARPGGCRERERATRPSRPSRRPAATTSAPDAALSRELRRLREPDGDARSASARPPSLPRCVPSTRP